MCWSKPPAEKPWLKYHRRVLNVDGPILDIGCLGWDWSSQFLGTPKKIIGYDPQESTVPNPSVILHQGLVASRAGIAEIQGDGLVGGLRCDWSNPAIRTVPTYALYEVLRVHRPSLVKLNVEGDEFSLLASVDHPVADQLIVSFHDFMLDRWSGLSEPFIRWLCRWYDPLQTCIEWNWWVFLSKEPKK